MLTATIVLCSVDLRCAGPDLVVFLFVFFWQTLALFGLVSSVDYRDQKNEYPKQVTK